MKIQLIALAILFGVSGHGQNDSFQKLIRPQPVQSEWFGWSTSLEDRIAVIGAPNHYRIEDADSLEGAGAVYVFNEDKNGEWNQSQVLLNQNPKASDCFGSSVSISGKYLAIGCRGCDIGIKTSDSFHKEGAVFLYQRNDDKKWTPIQTLSLESVKTKNAQFGARVSLLGDYLLVSADKYKRQHQSGQGAVFLYERSKEGEWRLIKEVLSPAKERDFGNEINLFKDGFVASSEASDVVYGYKKTRNKSWELDFKLEKTSTQEKGFGSSVCITDNFLFIGSYGEGDYCFHDYEELPKTDSVYIINLMDEATFSFTDKLLPNIKAVLDSNGVSKEEFKKNAVLSESWLEREERKAGAGIVYVYEKDQRGDWKFLQELNASDRGADDHFGMCLSSKDDILVVGAFGDKLEGVEPKNGMFTGAAYIFKLSKNGRWEELRKLQSNQQTDLLKFGFSVDTDGKRVIIGSRYELDKGSKDAGAAYIWKP